MSHLMNTYARQPVAFTHGQGVWLWDTEGKRYLDALAGIAVSGLGHAHPDLTRTIAEQAGRLIHTSNLYEVPLQAALADRLCELSGMDEVVFGNSGAEANEAAIKLARLYGHKQGNDLPHIIVMEQAWHGRTIGTLAATGSEKARAGFGPLPAGFITVPYNDFDAIVAAGNAEPRTVAVLIEVLQGEGGIRVMDADLLRRLRQLCDERGWLLMIDEVQSGIGRTGVWFAHQHAGVKPDVMTLAKGLGSGVPIGAALTAGRARGIFTPGTHGTTFGGGPLVSAAALCTLDVMARDGLLANAERVGNALMQGLRQALAGTRGVIEVRGQGLMIGIELERPCGDLVHRARQAGLLINVTRDRVVRLLPPLILDQTQAAQIIDILVPLIKTFLAESLA